jgi:hypothetical protein
METQAPLTLDEARELAREVLRLFPWRCDQQAEGAQL